MFSLTTLALPDHALLMVVRPPPHDLSRLHGLDGAGWAALSARATSANLAPLLFYTLRHEGMLDLAPAEVRQHLSEEYYASVRRQMVFNAELEPVLAALHAHGVVPLLLKGVVLAETTYPDVGLRPMTDIDILVHAADLPRVCEALQRLGYHTTTAAAKLDDEFFNGELSFAKGTHTETLAIEFHQNLVHHWNFTAPLKVDSDALWLRAQPLTVANQPVVQLCIEDMLLHLCLHRAMHHGFTGLPGYVDIAWMIATHGQQIRWDQLTARAHAYRAQAIVFLALQLARDLLGAAVPDSALEALAPPRWRQRLLQRLVDLELILSVDVAPSQEDAGRVLNVAVIDSWPGILSWVRQRLFPGVRWQKTNYALDSTIHAYAYALVVHPVRIVGGFVTRAARLALRNRSDVLRKYLPLSQSRS
jgi:hypothetical protein